MRVVVGKVAAYVAEGQGAEEGVGQGMDGHVGVAVAQQATVMGYVYAADHAAAALNEPVYVETAADAGKKL